MIELQKKNWLKGRFISGHFSRPPNHFPQNILEQGWDLLHREHQNWNALKQKRKQRRGQAHLCVYFLHLTKCDVVSPEKRGREGGSIWWAWTYSLPPPLPFSRCRLLADPFPQFSCVFAYMQAKCAYGQVMSVHVFAIFLVKWISIEIWTNDPLTFGDLHFGFISECPLPVWFYHFSAHNTWGYPPSPELLLIAGTSSSQTIEQQKVLDSFFLLFSRKPLLLPPGNCFGGSKLTPPFCLETFGTLLPVPSWSLSLVRYVYPKTCCEHPEKLLQVFVGIRRDLCNTLRGPTNWLRRPQTPYGNPENPIRVVIIGGGEKFTFFEPPWSVLGELARNYRGFSAVPIASFRGWSQRVAKVT